MHFINKKINSLSQPFSQQKLTSSSKSQSGVSNVLQTEKGKDSKYGTPPETIGTARYSGPQPRSDHSQDEDMLKNYETPPKITGTDSIPNSAPQPSSNGGIRNSNDLKHLQITDPKITGPADSYFKNRNR